MSIGLDIGSKTIKIVELEKSGKGFRLVASAITAYNGRPLNLMEQEKEFAEMSDLIRKVLRETKFKGKNVCLSLPEPLVFTRLIHFPQLTDQEIDSAVKWEAEQYIPIPVAEAIFEHEIIERKSVKDSGQVDVLLVAAPRLLVEKYLKVAQMSGLTPVAIETELLSLSRALAPLTGTSVILDFGASSTNLAIVKDGSLRFSRSIPTAGEAFTRATSQVLGINQEQAEEYKKVYGLSSNLEGKVAVAMSPILEVVIEEIKKAIYFYQSEEKGEAPTSAIISGGTSAMPEITTALSRSLGLEIATGNPFAKVVAAPEVIEKIGGYAPFYSIAIGLALRDE